MGISLIGNSPCKIASEILCLSESSSSQQPVKAAGPPASPGAASAACCQPDLLVKMVKPPCAITLPFPVGARLLSSSISLLPSRSQSSLLLTQCPRGAGCFPSLGEDVASLPAGAVQKDTTVPGSWLNYILDRTMCQGVLCPGEACKVVKGAAQSNVWVGATCSFALPRLECRKHKPSSVNLPTALWYSCKSRDAKPRPPANPRPLQLGFVCFGVSCGV